MSVSLVAIVSFATGMTLGWLAKTWQFRPIARNNRDALWVINERNKRRTR